MARISGINLQDSWKIDYALTKIKGIGWTLSNSILTDMKVSNEKKVSDLTKEEISKLASKISQYDTEGELNRQVRTNISRLRNIGSYRGTRHARGLPSRGQRTRSNARTKRGRRKTVGAFRKEALVKMQQPKT